MYDQAIQLDPKTSSAYNNKGFILPLWIGFALRNL